LITFITVLLQDLEESLLSVFMFALSSYHRDGVKSSDPQSALLHFALRPAPYGRVTTINDEYNVYVVLYEAFSVYNAGMESHVQDSLATTI
jgi:hypothetical protein